MERHGAITPDGRISIKYFDRNGVFKLIKNQRGSICRVEKILVGNSRIRKAGRGSCRNHETILYEIFDKL